MSASKHAVEGITKSVALGDRQVGIGSTPSRRVDGHCHVESLYRTPENKGSSDGCSDGSPRSLGGALPKRDRLHSIGRGFIHHRHILNDDGGHTAH